MGVRSTGLDEQRTIVDVVERLLRVVGIVDDQRPAQTVAVLIFVVSGSKKSSALRIIHSREAPTNDTSTSRLDLGH
jgi:hypothetical protein